MKGVKTMSELFPIVSGLTVGVLLGLLRPTTRTWVGAILAVAFGGLATVVSGEFAVSWGFLLIDIPLVAASSIAGLGLLRRLRLGSWSVSQR